MNRKPRDPEQSILNGVLIFRIYLVLTLMLIGAFGLFEWELQHGESLASARTAAANVLVFSGIFYLFNCRSLEYSMFHVGLFSNLWVVFGALTMTLLATAFHLLATDAKTVWYSHVCL